MAITQSIHLSVPYNTHLYINYIIISYALITNAVTLVLSIIII